MSSFASSRAGSSPGPAHKQSAEHYVNGGHNSYTSGYSETTTHDSSTDGQGDESFSERERSSPEQQKSFHDPHDVSFGNEEVPSSDCPAEGEKNEWSCQAVSGFQYVSFSLLVISFLGHLIAVCTPYWVAGWEGGKLVLNEGVWLSCYRERTLAQWVCSTYSVIRKQNQLPVWFQAAQIIAVLGLILLIPAIVTGCVYSYVANLKYRPRASWIYIAMETSSAICAFLSIVIFGGKYPTDQQFPTGEINFHASFALQIVSFLICLMSLAAHVRDSHPGLFASASCSNKLSGAASSKSTQEGTGMKPSSDLQNKTATKSIHIHKTNVPCIKINKSALSKPSFTLPKFPSALFRSNPDSRKEEQREVNSYNINEEEREMQAVTFPSNTPTTGRPAPMPRVVSRDDSDYRQETLQVPSHDVSGSQRKLMPGSYQSYKTSTDSQV